MTDRLPVHLALLLSIPFVVPCLAAARPSSDTLPVTTMGEVVVTATRTERRLGNTAVPVTLIDRETIRRSGSLRMHDILGEQTGLFITQGFGRGVQMQGMSPDYTLILVDGEPLIGRMGGVLDLSRITVGNIRRIEIVKGPSSSLYGSEALAGVINIITDRSQGRRLSTDLRYGRFNTIDASAQASIRKGRLGLSSFANSYSTRGYSLLPNALQRTVEPFWRGSAQLGASLALTERTKAEATVRLAMDDIRNSIVVQNLGNQLLSYGSEVNRDANITTSLSHRFSESARTTLRAYSTGFRSEQALEVGGQAHNYNDRFRQTFARIENQTDIGLGDRMSLTFGGGAVGEQVRSNRYDSLETRRSNEVRYLFLQDEWRPTERLRVIGGLRFDHNSTYASVLSPKLALQFAPHKSWKLNASVGRGFKAPDFRQLWLNFTNVAAGGYSVFGARVASDEIRRLEEDGQLDQVLPAFRLLADLRPETSTGINLSVHLQPSERWSSRLNVFRNDIGNLILTDVIAYRRSGGQIFSYLNISRAFTQGLEWEGTLQPFKGLRLQAGYQYLQTADKDVLDLIGAGGLFGRDPSTGRAQRLERKDYAGLAGRSAHMANLKAFHETADGRWTASLRLTYRSRWGTSDIDGNGVINRDDEYARGFVQVNLSVGRRISDRLQVQAGVDNLLDYRDPVNLPGLPGFSGYLSASFQPFQSSDNKKPR